jgi:hypothetical protein
MFANPAGLSISLMSESPVSPAVSDTAREWRPSPDDVDIYRALVGRRTQIDRPHRGLSLDRLRGWRHWSWFEGMLARIVRRAREGADRLAK